MTTKTVKDITEYVEWQSQHKCKALSAKPEHDFNDLGNEITVWNVKTDNDGDWWVVEGKTSPMNLYPQGAYYFSADEVYSFHIGLMTRMERDNAFSPENFVEALSQGATIAPQLFRKLKMVSKLLDEANEIEHFQSIGVQCREALIELANAIYTPKMCAETTQPKGSDFKGKSELFIQHCLDGSENADYRSYIKKMTESTWVYGRSDNSRRFLLVDIIKQAAPVMLIVRLQSGKLPPLFFNDQAKRRFHKVFHMLRRHFVL